MSAAGGWSAQQERALAAVLDVVVPPSADGRLPGAGELGLAAELGAAPTVARAAVVAALDALDRLAARRGHEGFLALPAEERAAAVGELAASEADLFTALVFQTYAAYYRQARIIEALGMEARPPYPKGYEVADLDPALLEPVRRMGRRYRDV